MSAVAPIPGWGIAHGHTLGECASAEGCGMSHDPEPVVYAHPDDIDLDLATREASGAIIPGRDEDAVDGLAAVEAMAGEIRRLRGQRSTLAHALVRADARAALAELGLITTDTTGRR